MDIFFSYCSSDRERIQLFRDALIKRGFNVFWDQEVPIGKNWSSWILESLSRARCVVVFWSKTSICSPNVHHEATIARDQDKIIPVLLDPLSASEFPMGHYSTQGILIQDWQGDQSAEDWQRLSTAIEGKVTPHWIANQWLEKESKFKSEIQLLRNLRDKSEAAERDMSSRLTETVRKLGATELLLSSSRSSTRRPLLLALSFVLPCAVFVGILLGQQEKTESILLQIGISNGVNGFQLTKHELARKAREADQLEGSLKKERDAHRHALQQLENRVRELTLSMEDAKMIEGKQALISGEVTRLEKELRSAIDLSQIADDKLKVLRHAAKHGDTESKLALMNMHLSGSDAVPPEEAADHYIELVKIGRIVPPSSLQDSWSAEWEPRKTFRTELLRRLPNFNRNKLRGTFYWEDIEALKRMYKMQAGN